ncbi:hypothetical protein D6D23_02123 [Aureobasidium pullulans]|uniref:polynucleotide adenylyltransferase n=1 Tax=Aureobasidium pullulans TaxID=5580 RepID=A0A4S8WPW6_AURPU|nr:hypothetical protein D6D23_02123 [Aureobasidium pullulans]THW65700.1 hypothetical protein D6D20_01982 [Aureobasidium pullulans]THW98779.1 hypothetical protein D6D18_04972 [Aureobasidium pullulans]THZ32671.1 hypothetical protein D6C89_00176 [Aureobasidium pullulans]THZ59296.1 hypothetical protein D6C85_10059 [Aureobasidium pullulans]
MAAASFHQRRSTNSQQSNSVPSTPHQHPRDLRFHSRSPSPSKTIGHSSPHSSASGAVGTPAVPKPAQGICKFESGAEYRTRRIPYLDGGNEPLPPPTEEPKAALEAEQDVKLSGDMRELYDRLLPTDESEERRRKLVQKLEDILNGEWPGNEIRVNVFGSSGNLLSSNDSDVDVCVTTPLKALESMHTLAAVLDRHGMDKVICRASAKVPIVKIWDPELQLACDLNVNNPLALENTRMIKTYVQIDERVRPLAKVIKYWTKRRILNDAAFGGTISSYTWICMILNFLQTRDPPILPSLQKIPSSRSTQANGQISSFADNLEELRGFGKDNHESLGQLIFYFFRHYGYVFDYQENVVSVKEGRPISRKEKGWDTKNYTEKESRSSLCVEEPFNTQRNLGNSADDYAFSGIHKEIRRAFELLKDGSGLEECCAQFEWPIEEKPIFQRPPPKPKPILTRSASQSGRPNNGNSQGRGNGNGTRNNRNSSNQRNNGRRSSSGTAYNPRMPYAMSPPVGINPADYFSSTAMSTDQLHNQLYKQYRFLQAQQEALRNQLLQQQQTQVQLQQVQAQAQARGVDLGTSPRSRQFTNNVQSPHSPRTFENSPTAAPPLLPGYLYHYPARYPPPSPLSQSRNTEDALVGPSSPSLQNAAPALRRGVHRGSITEGTANASVRSQSQPGRSFPNPLTLQGLAHPGYDVSGAIATPYMMPRSVQQFAQIQPNGSIRQPNGSFSGETAMPKEYVGYYVGQSPQLIPQYQSGNLVQVPQLRDIAPQPDRRISPELTLPISDGLRHQSRSPSPFAGGRRHSSSASAHPIAGSQPFVQQPLSSMPVQPKFNENQGPVIVNGSNMASTKQRQPSVTAASAPLVLKSNGTSPDLIPTEQIQQMSLDASMFHTNGQQHDMGEAAPRHLVGRSNGHVAEPSLPAHVAQNVPTPVWRQNAPDPQGLSNHMSSASQAQDTNHTSVSSLSESMQAASLHPSMGPLLSPVAEIRTPSPTAGRAAETSKIAPHHKLAQSVQIANGKNVEAATKTHNGNSGRHDGGKHQAPTSNSASTWQQAPARKTHKKNKSNTGSKGSHVPKTSGGEPLPANEADRKGG